MKQEKDKMYVKLNMLFKNGKEEEVTLEATKEDIPTVEGIANIVYTAFKDGTNAVLEFRDGQEKEHIIRVGDLSKFTYVFINVDANSTI